MKFEDLAKEPLEFTDLSDEEQRTYIFNGGDKITIHEPIGLHLKKGSTGHRVINAAGTSFYIPGTWNALTWVAKPGKPRFRF